MADIPKTIATFDLNGGQVFPVPFEYLARRFVFVTLVGPSGRQELVLNVDYRFTTKTEITTTRIWGTTDGFEQIELRRYTSGSDRLVDFSDGSVLRAIDLNTSQIQSIHIAEEGRDVIDDRLGLDGEGNLDAHGRRIINLQSGVNPGDAVNVTQLRGTEAAAAASVAAASEQARRAQRAADSASAAMGSLLSPRLPPYNAKGNGVDNDTAAFAAFEVDYKVRTVDLGGGSYLVDQIPTGNIYVNGSWRLSGGSIGFTRTAFEGDSVLNRGPIFSPYGGGLNRLRADLLNPLIQEMGLVWIGDSITWGSGNQPETQPNGPRNGTLKDPRDYFGTNSYVNHMRRYFIEEYMQKAVVTTEKWPESPWGDAIVHARRRVTLLPYGPDFDRQIVGTNITIVENDSAGRPTKKRILITNYNTTGGRSVWGEVSFNFTGRQFILLLGCVVDNESDYEIRINGVLHSTHSTNVGAPTDDGLGLINGGHSERTHNIPFVDGGVVTIRALRPDGFTGTSVFRLGGLIIDRHLRLTNNGINGSAFSAYRLYNMPPTGVSYSGSVAINEGDRYCFIQLGTNDRGTNRHAQTVHALRTEIKAFLDVIPSYCTPILTCASPAKEVVGANLSMEDVRCAIGSVARDRAIDWIDNYAAFRGVKIGAFASDELHPNAWGYTVMAANVIKSLEASIDISVKPAPAPIPLVYLLPTDARFVVSGTLSIVDRDAALARLGKQRLVRNNGAQTGEVTFKVVNADRFGIGFSSASGHSMDYEVFVDDVSQGVFRTEYLAVGGGTNTYGNIRWHEFPLGEHTIRVKPIYWAEGPGTNQVLYLEAFAFQQTATVTA